MEHYIYDDDAAAWAAHLDEMSDPAAERITAHLDGIDAAADWTPIDAMLDGFPMSYDEWNAIRRNTGRPCGTFYNYMTELSRSEERRLRETLIYFGAIDDDDCVPDEGES
jgi:hypothetical protein